MSPELEEIFRSWKIKHGKPLDEAGYEKLLEIDGGKPLYRVLEIAELKRLHLSGDLADAAIEEMRAHSFRQWAYRKGITLADPEEDIHGTDLKDDTKKARKAPTEKAGETYIASDFAPSLACIRFIESLGIPESFSTKKENIDRFIFHWTERKEPSKNWQSLYVGWVEKAWDISRQSHQRTYGIDEVRDVSWMNTGIRYDIDGEDF
jgi:hypothetical protein